MTGRKRALGPGALVLSCSVAVAAAVACGPAEEELPPATPSSKPRPPDRTEVTMQVTPVTTTAPSAIAAAPSTPATMGSSASGDSSDEVTLAGKVEPAVEKAVAPVRGRLRACYKKALAAEPGLSGTATFDATIAKDGHVASARFVKREGLNEDMIGCLLNVMKAMSFEGDQKSQIVPLSFGRPSGGGGATAVAPDAGAKK